MATYNLVWSPLFFDGVTASKDRDGRLLVDPNASLAPSTTGLRIIPGFKNGLRTPMLAMKKFTDGVTSSPDMDGLPLIDPVLYERQRPAFRRGGGAPFALGLITKMLSTPRYYKGTLGKDQDGTLQVDPLSGTYRNAGFLKFSSGFALFPTTYQKLTSLFTKIPDIRLTDPKQRT